MTEKNKTEAQQDENQIIAERRAKLLADAAGVHLGKVERIDESGIQVPRPLMAAADFAMRASAVPVATGEQEIRVTLSVRFSIQ